MFLRVLTDAGIEGNCTTFVMGRERVEFIEKIVSPGIIGHDPLYREAIWQQMWRQSRLTFPHQLMQGPIDVCLWDIAGKAAGMPIYKLLGACREKVPAYASSRTLPTPEDYAREASQYAQKGYTAYKLHAFGDPHKDVAACRAARQAVGDDIDLMLDAVAAYDRAGSLYVGRELEDLNFLWLEEPLPDWDVEGYARLSEALDIPVAGTEVVPGSIYSTSEYLLRRAVDIVRSDVIFKGGIGPVKKTAGMAEAFGMNLEIHTTGTPLSNVANLHVMCAIKNSRYHEILVPEEFFGGGVIEDVAIDSDGCVTVPDKPGLGLEIDWDYINTHKEYETPSGQT
jgi:L-alanine-DL-glutamate epimerase-like enolase superfamily enzyme